MNRARWCAGLVVAALSTVAAACDDYQPIRPTGTAPSPIATPATSGQVSLRSIIPASGATLSMNDCTYEPETAYGNTQLCTGDSRIGVDIEFDRDITASIVVYFYRGSQICARSENLFQGSRGSVELNIISLTSTSRPDEVLTTATDRCALPIVTTRAVLKVLERSSNTPRLELSQDFAHTYTFTPP